jgi:hypothetical protein
VTGPNHPRNLFVTLLSPTPSPGVRHFTFLANPPTQGRARDHSSGRRRRERYLALDTKLGVISKAAQTMLELAQTKRSLHVEYYIVALIVFEVVIGIVELIAKHA